MPRRHTAPKYVHAEFRALKAQLDREWSHRTGRDRTDRADRADRANRSDRSDRPLSYREAADRLARTRSRA